MDRLVLSDAAWDRIALLITGRPDQKGAIGRDNRMFVEGVLWIVCTGSSWRDLPEEFGDWNSVFQRFSRWDSKGVWRRIFEAMSDDPDFEYRIVDSIIVRSRQHNDVRDDDLATALIGRFAHAADRDPEVVQHARRPRSG